MTRAQIRATMTRAQFAIAVGAPEKWVHNAAAALGRPIPYTVAAARRLAVARAIQALMSATLADAAQLAGAVLRPAAASASEPFVIAAGAGGTVTLDLQRVRSTFGARLARALRHTPRRPGRRTAATRQGARARAEAYGLDLSLIDSNLRRPPAERLSALDANAAFLTGLAAVRPRRSIGPASAR